MSSRRFGQGVALEGAGGYERRAADRRMAQAAAWAARAWVVLRHVAVVIALSALVAGWAAGVVWLGMELVSCWVELGARPLHGPSAEFMGLLK
jgi:hypothetical protein